MPPNLIKSVTLPLVAKTEFIDVFCPDCGKFLLQVEKKEEEREIKIFCKHKDCKEEKTIKI